MTDATEFNTKNLINVSTQNNFCGYYVLARRLINDDNFAVILEKFNQFYQTNWSHQQLSRVLRNMHPEQAEIMLGLVIYNQYPIAGQAVDSHQLINICSDFNYNLYLSQSTEAELPSVVGVTQLHDQPNHKEIFVLLRYSGDNTILGHYYLIEPDEVKLAKDASLRDPSYEGHTYAINNQGGDTQTFIYNIQESVAQINQIGMFDQENQQIQEDKEFALQLAAYDRRSNDRASIKHFSFFKENPISVTEQEKAEILKFQEDKIKYFNDLISTH